MASNHLTPVESIISGEASGSHKPVKHHSPLPQSESQRALVDCGEESLSSDTDSNQSPRNAATAATSAVDAEVHLKGHSSLSSIEVLNNNKQEPIHLKEDIVPAVHDHIVHPHYIGYHPERLFKVKGKLHNSEGVAFLPEDRMVVADKHDGHIMLFDGEGKFEKTLVKGVKPCGVATNRSGTIAFTDIKDKREKVVKVMCTDLI